MSINEEVELLRKVPLFAGLDPAKLKLLAFTSDRLRFPAGAALFEQGEPGDAAYLLLEGEAEVTVNAPEGPLRVATLARHEIVGEIAILCDVPRTATVRAVSDVTALRVTKEQFLRLIEEFPEMSLEIMRELARRLEVTTTQLREARRDAARERSERGN